jgi:hypothetical protein
MADTVQGKPGAVVPNDIRLAAAALLVASDGEVLGQAAVLSPDLAVTTAEVAQYASAKVAGPGNAPSSAFGPLAITFPKFQGSPGVYPLRATLEAIDSELGFATIRFSGTLPTPIPTGLLGTGDSPGIGIACDVFYSDVSWSAFYQVAAKLETRMGARLRVTLADVPDEPLATALAAAPVFAGYRFIGIVLTASSGIAEVLSVDGMALSRVTPAVRALLPWIDPARSEVPVPGAAVRTSAGSENQIQPGSPTQSDASLGSAGRTNASARMADTESQSVRATSSKDALEAAVPPPGGYQSKVSEVKESVILDAMKRAHGDAAEAAKILDVHPGYLQRLIRNLGLEEAAKQAGAGEISDEQVWERMTPAARRVFERAMGMMQASRAVPGIATPADKKESNSLHMEFLIAALFESQKESFARAQIDRSELRRILRQAVGTTIPEDYQSQQLDALPETSKHVRKAIAESDKYATKQRARHINDSHLLHGAMFVQDCRVTGALTDAGMRWQNLLTYTDPDDLETVAASVSTDQQVTEKPTSAPPVADLKVETKIVGESAVPTAAPTPKVDSDLWCETDKLGYEGYARTIAGLITHPETVPPLTIGIKAPWGAGKTSLMKRVQHLLDGRAELSEKNRSGARQLGQTPQLTMGRLRSELKEIARDEQGTSPTWSSMKTWLWRTLGKTDKPVRLPTPSNVEGAGYGLPPRVTVWFNAWKYQTSEQIWAGMAHCIISQVTARMPPLDRELFWLRLHARRINTDEVRRKVHGVLLRALAPAALMIVVGVAIVVWLSSTVQSLIPYQWSVRVVTSLAGLIGVIWKARATLGEKAAGTVKELVREPDYEGKMGYLHLVESDIREVLNLVTVAGVDSKAEASSSQSQNPHFSQRQGEVGHPVALSPSMEKPTPLVVFVDDLDRCAPNKVAEVVEAINLFLCGDYPNCIFVLGMEPGMVAAALEVANKDVIAKAREMGLVDGAAPVGWRFMEKIVQMPVMIPPPTRRGRDSYVESLVGSAASVAAPGARAPTAAPVEVSAPAKKEEPKKAEPPKEEEVRGFVQQMQGANLAEVEKKSLEIVAQAAPEKRKAAAEAGKRVYAQTFSERDPVIADFVQECADLVDGNPRQIKRYVNVFRFYSTLRYGLRADGLAKAEELPSDKMLAKFVALSIQWPHAMDCLRGRHHVESDGRAVSRLEFLELKSLEMNGDDAGTEEKWKDVVGEKGMKLESWAEARAFRTFLARGEMLGKSAGHGLW